MHRHTCYCGKEWNCEVDIWPNPKLVYFEFDGRVSMPMKYNRAVRCDDSFPSLCEDCSAMIEAESEWEDREALHRGIHESLTKVGAHFRERGLLT